MIGSLTVQMSATWPPPAPAAGPVTECYRHHKVPAPVTCTRCDRPICTDCMISAPVGWQCPECLKGAPAVRRMRDIQGGALGLTGGRKPYVTYALIAVCVAAYIGQQGSDLTERGQIVASKVAQGEVWRIVTSGFLHASIIHIAFNMLILFQLGTVLEPRIGRARFLALYTLSLIGGSIGVMLLQPPTTPAIGASGAVFGLMGGIVVLGKRGRSPLEAGVVGLLVLNLVVTFALPGIAIGGHIGGLVAGALGGLVIRLVGERGDLRRVALTTVLLVALSLPLALGARPVARTRCGDVRQSSVSLADLNRLTPQQLRQALVRARSLCA